LSAIGQSLGFELAIDLHVVSTLGKGSGDADNVDDHCFVQISLPGLIREARIPMSWSPRWIPALTMLQTVRRGGELDTRRQHGTFPEVVLSKPGDKTT
jgi:hypothetical protein